MAILMELRVIPIGTSSTSLSTYISSIIRLVSREGYKYVLGPMGTSIEVNSFEDIAKLLKDIVDMLRGEGVNRVVIDIALDIRFDKEAHLEMKIRSVEEKLSKTT